MSAGPTLVVRADGGPGIGYGHLARGLALAEAWRAGGGAVELVSDGPPDSWRSRYEEVGAEVADIRPMAELGGDWVALDGYRFGVDDQRAARVGAGQLLVIDDHGSVGEYDADLVLDQNLGADAARYQRRADLSRLLLGPRYALLRRAFGGREVGAVEDATTLLIALGGSPPPAAERLADVVAQRWADSARRSARLVDVNDVESVMAGCDLAFSASGSTVWELACTGVPMALMALADNQEPVGRRMAEAGAARYLGPLEGLDAAIVGDELIELAGDRDARLAMASVAAHLVDGLGARRVVAAMRARLLRPRPVDAADAELLWTWVNDPATRASAFDSDPIPWETHRAWLAQRLDSPSSTMVMASDNDGPIGQVRFDVGDSTAEVDVSVAPDRRGQGWAGALIRAATDRFLAEADAVMVEANVKPDNVASARAFLAADFDLIGEACPGSPQPLRYARRRDDHDEPRAS